MSKPSRRSVRDERQVHQVILQRAAL